MLFTIYVETVSRSDPAKQNCNNSGYSLMYVAIWVFIKYFTYNTGNQYDGHMTNTSNNTIGCILNPKKFKVVLVVLCSALFFIVGNVTGFFFFYICKMCCKKHQHPKTKPNTIIIEKNAAYCNISPAF